MILKDYIFIARFDHWFKNIFILPGVIVALVISHTDFSASIALNVCISLLSCSFIASANYVINEWLDSAYDRFHPVKRNRPGAQGHLEAKYVLAEYAFFVILGLSLASLLSFPYVVTSIILLCMGVAYNTPPLRTKDIAFLDVISESFNNPLRFTMGWFAVASTYFPPSSILIAYWAGGAFLMTVKRYAEYRFINDPESAALYRRSFKNYTEKSLLLYAIFYAIASSFFLAVFLVKYRQEFILSFPLFALLFVWYLAIGMRPLSPAQSPEKIYKDGKFCAFLLFLTIVIFTLLVVDIPSLHMLQEPFLLKLNP